MRCTMRVSAKSCTTDSGSDGDTTDMKRIGESAGFVFRNVGGAGISLGGGRCTAAIADCTSCAAASMLRSNANCSVIDVVPSALVDVMLSMPEMVENCCSSGVATAEAIVSGVAPGRLAVTTMVGK